MGERLHVSIFSLMGHVRGGDGPVSRVLPEDPHWGTREHKLLLDAQGTGNLSQYIPLPNSMNRVVCYRLVSSFLRESLTPV